MAHRLAEAAAVLGVSDDTVRRWAEAGRVPARPAADGRLRIAGDDLADLAVRLVEQGPRGVHDDDRAQAVSARNRMRGVVTRVVADTVMAQVELVCGPYRIVSLMSTEAATALGLERGTIAVASVKATNVVVERP